jgi:hypothetical protein
MRRLRKSITGISTTNRSRVTNGTRLLVGVDGRSTQARRFRDLMHAYKDQFDSATADRNLVRQAALLALKREQLQAAVVRGEPVGTDTLTNLAGRTLADLRRKTQAAAASAPAQPSVIEHIAAGRADEQEPDD